LWSAVLAFTSSTGSSSFSPLNHCVVTVSTLALVVASAGVSLLAWGGAVEDGTAGQGLEEPLLGAPLQRGERREAQPGTYAEASTLSRLVFTWAGQLLRTGYNLHYGEFSSR
jgi:hypothetical protein